MEAADEKRARAVDPAGAMIMAQQTISNSSRYSYYVDDALYRELIEDYAGLRQADHSVLDAAKRDMFRALVEREARLLDQLRFQDWLGCYADECIYWVPSTPTGGDPRSEISVMFDDRRRLEDRIFRFATGFAWSQAPSSRTVRLVSNVEVFASASAEQWMVRSNFIINEFWDNETRQLSGWSGHRFRKIGDDWKISAKQVNLLECDQSIRNPSIIL
jgi:benzoate/toluate 1,2-dioxygenase beta subunit